ncbi:hypothetical protein LAU43_00145 [Macrococcus armenti]|nr:hypothetical protein [Macrococcus armenti]UBH13153.1 hypothetical protein LAU43_00145 [Macrococcus armenti]
MSHIKLNDLLGFTEEEMNHVKIKFNQSNGFVDSMEVFKQNPEEVNTQWLFWRNKSRYFNVGQTASILPRNLSAACHNFSSNPIVAIYFPPLYYPLHKYSKYLDIMWGFLGFLYKKNVV